MTPIQLKLLHAALFSLLLTSTAAMSASVHVAVQALFKDRAMLLINGRQQLLRAGETGHAGVKLIKATGKYADIEVGGEVRRITVSGGVHTNFTEPQEQSVSILADPTGAYFAPGTINGESVRFLVDTGANAVALNSQEAQRLGLDYRSSGEQGLVTTASGQVQGFGVRLDRVQVGEIEVLNVPAVVIEGSYPQYVLLGMTFLREVEMREKSGLMELRR